LRSYGQDLGLLYQLTDDLLDIYGDSQKMGKPTGQDTHKSTVISLQGVKKVQQQISILYARIQDHLALFGDRAERLLQIALWISKRCA
jgi:geranylgeranyl pyrophosphate synthase